MSGDTNPALIERELVIRDAVIGALARACGWPIDHVGGTGDDASRDEVARLGWVHADELLTHFVDAAARDLLKDDEPS